MEQQETKVYKGQPYVTIKLKGEAMENLIAKAEAEGQTITKYLVELLTQD
ncbi:hypothetical protein RA178_06215 [Shewanella oncorhynchi]|uniref:Uncharacterized protein n=1 Tax=Shewanella oncorhynchi TaxID=2726434 RepID=A0AA50KH31_9GAMM|nr:hypothetical protein [Shewanella oncorhynchi]WMB74206.1 hypothetical protein RA178_06215 [Shewanella oncorhynchi]